jgi:hypothetical protein
MEVRSWRSATCCCHGSRGASSSRVSGSATTTPHGSHISELLRATLICLPLKGFEVALGYDRLLGAEGPVPKAGNPLS